MHKPMKTLEKILGELISKMAAAGDEFHDWRSLLNNHSISKYLRKQSESGASRHQSKEAKSLICIQSSDLFIWCASEGCILHCNLKALASVEENQNVQRESESVSPRSRSNLFGASDSSVQSCSFQVRNCVESGYLDF